jgi:hypothetical protein
MTEKEPEIIEVGRSATQYAENMDPNQMLYARRVVDDLIVNILEKGIKAVFFLDRSARPFGQLLKRRWRQLEPNVDCPHIFFINVGRGNYDYLNTFEPMTLDWYFDAPYAPPERKAKTDEFDKQVQSTKTYKFYRKRLEPKLRSEIGNNFMVVDEDSSSNWSKAIAAKTIASMRPGNEYKLKDFLKGGHNGLNYYGGFYKYQDLREWFKKNIGLFISGHNLYQWREAPHIRMPVYDVKNYRKNPYFEETPDILCDTYRRACVKMLCAIEDTKLPDDYRKEVEDYYNRFKKEYKHDAFFYRAYMRGILEKIFPEGNPVAFTSERELPENVQLKCRHAVHTALE